MIESGGEERVGPLHHLPVDGVTVVDETIPSNLVRVRFIHIPGRWQFAEITIHIDEFRGLKTLIGSNSSLIVGFNLRKDTYIPGACQGSQHGCGDRRIQSHWLLIVAFHGEYHWPGVSDGIRECLNRTTIYDLVGRINEAKAGIEANHIGCRLR